MTQENFCTVCFKSLGVPTRMEIYTYLQDKGEATVGDIVSKIKLTQPTISYHLGEMKDEAILKSRREGKEVYYSISTICPHSHGECLIKKISLGKDLHAKD